MSFDGIWYHTLCRCDGVFLRLPDFHGCTTASSSDPIIWWTGAILRKKWGHVANPQTIRTEEKHKSVGSFFGDVDMILLKHECFWVSAQHERKTRYWTQISQPEKWPKTVFFFPENILPPLNGWGNIGVPNPFIVYPLSFWELTISIYPTWMIHSDTCMFVERAYDYILKFRT